MEVEKAVLGVVDYIVFAAMLLVSAGIGVYFRFSGGKQKTNEEYLLAGQNMSILPVAFSLMTSFLSGITVLGVPAEIYNFGIHLAFINIGFSIGTIMAAYVSLPVFFEMQASSAYEYLERRFGKLARIMCSLAFILQMVLYMSVVLYAPALALSAVTDLSIWVAVISIGVVCTFYCTVGGMKAVLWTGVFQAILMFLGIFAVLIKGVIDVGGAGNVVRIAKEGRRLELPGFEFDPGVRYTVWNIICQGIMFSWSSFGGNQVQIQRMLTVKNMSRSRTAMFVNIPMGVVFHLLTCLVGVVMYSFYATCDPMTSPNKPIYSADQLMPYFMVSSLGEYPGLPGLCICGIFSASLSTVSSAINSLTAVTMEDLVMPFFESKGLSEKKMAFSSKVITLLYGSLCVAMTFLVHKIGNQVYESALTILGILGGPILAVFVLGMMTQRSNEKGVVTGLVIAIGLSAWISFGASTMGPPPVKLPMVTDGCSDFNITTEFPSNFSISPSFTISSLSFESTLNGTESIIDSSYDDVLPVYRISYMWFAPISFALSAFIGYFVSLIMSLILGKSSTPPDELLSPILKYFLKKNRDNKTMVELQGINNHVTSSDGYKEDERF